MSNSTPHDRLQPVTHYENFPVASWLCPAHLRPAVAAIYWFARTADDLADEGDLSPDQRLDALRAYRMALHAAADGSPPTDGPWCKVFAALAAAIDAHALPRQLLDDLLSAFEQDVHKTAAAQGYANRAELLAYCARSANPVGRLMLHLYRVADPVNLAHSDAICTALQLINFWQDLSIDLGRGRLYLPAEDCARHGVNPHDPRHAATRPAAKRLVAELVGWARESMTSGQALVHALPGRAGWELRLVVQGGLRVLDKIAAAGFDTLDHRPRLYAWDAPVLLWRALGMRSKQV